MQQEEKNTLNERFQRLLKEGMSVLEEMEARSFAGPSHLHDSAHAAERQRKREVKRMALASSPSLH